MLKLTYFRPIHILYAYLFILVFKIGVIFVESRYLGYANDGCSVVVSGSYNSRSVRTTYLGCHEGSLLWTNPRNSLLARFSIADGLESDQKYRLCIKFIEDHTTHVQVHKMENGLLHKSLLDHQQPDRLNCMPYDSDHKIALFMQSRFSDDDSNARFHAGFSYVIEKVDEKDDYAPPCGRCSNSQILNEYCSSDFIFHGTLLRSLPDRESLEFSLYGIIRRPVALGNIVSAFRPKSSLQTAWIFAKCNPEFVDLMTHKEFMVVTRTKLGVADLRCMVEYAEFIKLSEEYGKEDTPCQLQHEKKINPFSMK